MDLGLAKKHLLDLPISLSVVISHYTVQYSVV